MNQFFAPFSIGNLTLKNRFVMAPMTRNKSKKHIPGPQVAAYYERRAHGNVGLIITEGTFINHKAANGYPDVPDFFSPKALEGWAEIVKKIHAKGAKIFPQLWHVGSVRQTYRHKNQGVDNPKKQCIEENNVPGYAPSPIPHPYVENAEIPHEMTIQDIQEVIDAFAKAAATAKKLGFDGIELHGAHGYLIDQFFWKHTNRRQDSYGGKDIRSRGRFAVEVISAVRQAVGPEFPIDFRFSQWKLGQYDAKLAQNPKELEEFLLPLVEAGVDIFHCSTRRFWQPEFPNSDLNLAGWTKKITGKPTITVGSVGLDNDFVANAKPIHQDYTTLDELLRRYSNNEFDLIALGRSLLGDPEWVKKIQQGRINDITPFTLKALQFLH